MIDLLSRLDRVATFLKSEDLKVLVVDRPIDLFYLTGMELSLGRLVVTSKEAFLFVDGRYYEGCKSRLSIPVILTSGYDSESAFAQAWQWVDERAGFDADQTSYAAYEQLSVLRSQWVPLRNPLKKMREIKDSHEIGILQEAAVLGSKGYDYLQTQLREGISEIELAKSLELFWVKEGADRVAFPPHIAFGEGSAQPHYRPGNRKLKKGDVVLMDIGVVWDHYHSDMTRVVFYGEPRSEIAAIYPIVFNAYHQAVALCHPGTLIADVDQAARQIIEQAGYKEFFTHGLGHGVGLEIHEFPSIRAQSADLHRTLEPGMVLTIEPGIYLPQIGGVRLEDTLLITTTGHQNLTQRPLSSRALVV